MSGAAPVRISVVVPTYQRRESLRRLLDSLACQTLPAAGYEVIVVVDGSTDGSAEAARALAVPYRLTVLEGPNRGRAGACNAGVRSASADLVVLLDDDMEATPELLGAHARAHEGARPRAVVGAAPIVLPPDASAFVRYMADGFRKRMARMAEPGYHMGFRDTYTGNFSVPRAALLAAGGFDEAFRVYGHEDYELALRLQAAGVELGYSAEACARQHYEKSFAGFTRDGIARGRTAVLFAGKHPEIVDRIPLSRFHEDPWRWRTARRALLLLGRLSDRVPDGVVSVVGLAERLGARRMDKYYTLAIDYLYWHGALGAMREQGTSLPASSRPSATQPAPRGAEPR